MIKVEFVSQDGTRVHVASFKDDDVYISCLEVLEERALSTNSKIEETLLTHDVPTLAWEGVRKITYQGYCYGRYADLIFNQN